MNTYKDDITTGEVRNRIRETNGHQEDLLSIMERRKLRWYIQISCSEELANTIWQGTVKE